MDKKEFLKVNSEDVVAIYKEGEQVVALYMVETWEEPDIEDYENDQFRLLGYGSSSLPDQWELNSDLLSTVGLIDAIIDRQGYVCGQIYFYHEETEERAEYENVFDNLYQSMSGEDQEPTILEMTSEEWKSNWKQLEDGEYIIVFK